jgi:hypothetical protein
MQPFSDKLKERFDPWVHPSLHYAYAYACPFDSIICFTSAVSRYARTAVMVPCSLNTLIQQ